MKNKHKIIKLKNGSAIRFQGKFHGNKILSCGDRFLAYGAEPYTRQQAINDGILHNVTHIAQQVKIAFPVAISNPLWGLINDIPTGREHDTVNCRVVEILYLMKDAMIFQDSKNNIILFDIILETHCRNQLIRVKAVLEKGDNFETVITIGLPK